MITTILMRYQGYDPQSGQFDKKRSLREYARLLGVSHATLSVIYSGQREPSMDVLRAVAQQFPESSKEIAAALVAHEPVPRTPNDVRRLAGLPVLAAKEEVA